MAKGTNIYVGPSYPPGGAMVIRGNRYDPASMNAAQIKAFLARYPEHKSWWVVKLPPARNPKPQVDE